MYLAGGWKGVVQDWSRGNKSNCDVRPWMWLCAVHNNKSPLTLTLPICNRPHGQFPDLRLLLHSTSAPAVADWGGKSIQVPYRYRQEEKSVFFRADFMIMQI